MSIITRQTICGVNHSWWCYYGASSEVTPRFTVSMPERRVVRVVTTVHPSTTDNDEVDVDQSSGSQVRNRIEDNGKMEAVCCM
jgi:hypothetical protein